MTSDFRLYEFEDVDFEIPEGLHLLAGLAGFTDAGSAVSQFADNIFASLKHQLILRFSNDELLDYRSRRPIMYFERDHIEHYEPAMLGIYLVYDEANQPFLYLHGYEPDFKWEAFTDSLLDLIDILGIVDVTWVHSIPFPIPHTRSIGVTVSGNREDIISRFSEWKPQTQVPGNVLHLLEFKLAESGIDIAGLVLLVPHYLADAEYPEAAIAAFQQVSAATGLVFPTDPLREESARFMKKLASQLEENTELSRMISTLEQGYENEKTGPARAPISKPAVKIPSAEDIAAELEDYLAIRQRNQEEDTN